MKRKIKKSALVELTSETPATKLDAAGRIKNLLKRKSAPDTIDLAPGSTNIVELIAPASIDLKHKDYIVVDGVYHTYLYIAGYGYATTVGPGWLGTIIEAGEGINVCFQSSRQPKDKALNQITQTTMVNRSRMREVDDARQDFEMLDGAILSGLMMKDAMNKQGEDLHYMHTLIEVTADSPEALEQRAERVQNLCISQDLICKRADYMHQQAFLSMLPLAKLDEGIQRKTRRNALTTGVASAFPFSSFEIFHDTGIPIGIVQHNRSLCMPDFFDTTAFSNGNSLIAGMSGSGKTYLISIISIMLRLLGVKVIIIAPLKGFEFRLVCEAMNGSYIKLSPSSEDCINEMAIRKRTLHTEDGLSEARSDSLLADKIQSMHTYMRLRKRDMTDYEEHLLDDALVEVYGQFGITFDNDSVFRPDGGFKPMPTFHDLHAALHQKEGAQSLATALARYVTGSAKSLGGSTNVSLDNDYTVIDISEMPEDLLPEWMYVATNYAFDKCSESRLEKKALILEELWYLIGALSNERVAGFAVRIFKILRGMGGIAIGGTQELYDCFSLEEGKYGKAILNNTRLKFIFPMEEEEMAFAREKLNLTDGEVMQLSRNRRGECLFGVGRNRVSVSIHASRMIHDLITTDREDMLNRNRRETGEQKG